MNAKCFVQLYVRQMWVFSCYVSVALLSQAWEPVPTIRIIQTSERPPVRNWHLDIAIEAQGNPMALICNYWSCRFFITDILFNQYWVYFFSFPFNAEILIIMFGSGCFPFNKLISILTVCLLSLHLSRCVVTSWWLTVLFWLAAVPTCLRSLTATLSLTESRMSLLRTWTQRLWRSCSTTPILPS